MARRAAFPFGIPGPKRWPLVGNLLSFAVPGTKPWELLRTWIERYGPLTVWWEGRTPVLLLGSPELVGEVLVDDPASYYKDSPLSALMPILTEDNVFMAPGQAAWRKLVPDSLLATIVREDYDGWLGTQVAVVRDEVSKHLGRWVAARTEIPDITVPVYRLAFDTWSRMLLGQTFDDDRYAAYWAMGKAANSWMAPGPGFLKPSPDGPPFTTARATWFGAVGDRVASTRARVDPDRIDLLATARRRGTELTDHQLMADLSGSFFAGGFSAGMGAIVATLYELTRNPDVAAGLVAELRSMVDRKPDYGWPELAGCTLLDQVVRETLRTCPPVPIYMRNVAKHHPAKLGGKEIPANTMIMLTSYALQRAASHWPEPDVWRPARWTAAVTAANPYGSGHFWPFGRGDRSCAGQGFAQVYIKTTLATILTQSKPSVGAGQAYDCAIYFTVMTPKGLRAVFTV